MEKSTIAYSECPLCFDTFPSSNIAIHASSCTGEKKKPKAKGPVNVPSQESNPFLASRKRSDEERPAQTEPKKQKLEVSPSKVLKPEIDKKRHVPLAELIRPQTLDDYVGQHDVAGKDGFWRTLILSGKIPSMIFWGPPGCGKTSLVNVIANRCRSESNRFRFVSLSACTFVADVKEAVAKAKSDLNLVNRQTVLFIDEIHRFNKLQQDAFLPHVENGTLVLIGATTENPSFSLNSALLSRCRVVPLNKLSPESVRKILERGLATKSITITNSNVGPVPGTSISEEAVEYLSTISDGDARTALNCLEIALSRHEGLESKSSRIGLEEIKSGLRRAHLLYDRKGDEHYHCASALQKSIRGSNDNAALYWTMRMLEGGEDPMFIARRFVRIAAEDVGLADPKAIGIAVSSMQGCQLIGKPECNVLLAECAVYLARASKSHEVYHAMNEAISSIKSCNGNLPGVPIHLRNASSKLGRDLDYGKGYSYDLKSVQNIEYMPEGMEDVNFFENKS